MNQPAISNHRPNNSDWQVNPSFWLWCQNENIVNFKHKKKDSIKIYQLEILLVKNNITDVAFRFIDISTL